MNFKWNEFKEVLFKRQGFIPIALGLGIEVLTLFLFSMLLSFFFMFLGFAPTFFDSTEVGFIIVSGMLLFFIIIIPLFNLIQAGVYGTLKDCIEYGKPKGVKYLIIKGGKYFLPVLGYTLLFLLFIFIFSIPLIIISSIGFFIDDAVAIILLFLSAGIISVFAFMISPMIYLSVFEGNTFSHLISLYKKHFKELFIVSIISSILINLPIIQILIFLLYPLYVMVLFYDFPTNRNNEVKEINEMVEVKETEESKEVILEKPQVEKTE